MCDNGLLDCDVVPDRSRRYRDLLTLAGIYHDFDCALFYMNIRANLAERIAAYQRHKQ